MYDQTYVCKSRTCNQTFSLMDNDAQACKCHPVGATVISESWRSDSETTYYMSCCNGSPDSTGGCTKARHGMLKIVK